MHMTNSNIIFVLIISSNINYLKIYNNNDNVHHLKLHCSVKVYRCLGCPETSTVGTASLQIELHPHGWLISTKGRGRLNARQWPCERTSALHTVKSSFFKQGSDISHAKEQARYTLCTHRLFLQRSDMSHAKEQAPYTTCMPRSLSKDPA